MLWKFRKHIFAAVVSFDRDVSFTHRSIEPESSRPQDAGIRLLCPLYILSRRVVEGSFQVYVTSNIIWPLGNRKCPKTSAHRLVIGPTLDHLWPRQRLANISCFSLSLECPNACWLSTSVRTLLWFWQTFSGPFHANICQICQATFTSLKLRWPPQPPYPRVKSSRRLVPSFVHCCPPLSNMV